MGTQERICRLCLKMCDGFKAIEGDLKDVLDKVLPKIDLASTLECVMCAGCVEMLTKCFDIKVAGFYRHDYKVPLDDEAHVKLDPDDVHLGNGECGTGILDQELCGLCISPVKNCISLDFESGGVMLETMLKQFFPEMELSIIKKPVICGPCHGSLEKCFRFVTSSQSVEEKVKKYREALDVHSKCQIELRNVLKFTTGDITSSEVDSNPVPIIKVEKQFCEEAKYTDDREIGTGGNMVKFEQVFCNEGENVKEEDEHKNQSCTDMGDRKLGNEESNILDAIKVEEIFCGAGDTEVKEENFVEMEDQNYLVNEDIQGNIDESDYDRLEDGVFPQQGVSTKSQRSCKSLASNPSGDQSKPHIKRTSRKKRASKTAVYKCESCSFRTKYKQSLKIHCQQHKNPWEVPMYQCDTCSFQTRYKDGLKIHMLIHKSPSELTMYKCDLCSFETKRKEGLKSHLLAHKDPSELTMHECKFCFFQTKDKHYLKKHLLVHKDASEVEMYKCDTCLYESRHKHAFLRHLILHKNPEDVTMYKCDSCEFQTKNKYYLKNHLLVHKDPSEVTMYKCELCPFQTKRNRRLRDHMQVHMDLSELTLYKCESCSFQTKRKDSLRSHMVAHKDPSEITMYKCDSCSFQTKDKYYLKKHWLVHKNPSEVEMYKCETCVYQTKRKHAFKRHLILHKNPSEIEMHKCASCSFESRYKHCLKRHLPVHKE